MPRDPYVATLESLAKRIRKLESQITYIPAMASIWIPANNFTLVDGAPVFMDDWNDGAVWLFGQTGRNSVGTYFAVPRYIPDNSLWDFYAYFAMTNTTSGDAVLELAINDIEEGETISAYSDGVADIVPVPTTELLLKIYKMSESYNNTLSGDLFKLRFRRDADSSDDTAASALAFFGLMVDRNTI